MWGYTKSGIPKRGANLPNETKEISSINIIFWNVWIFWKESIFCIASI